MDPRTICDAIRQHLQFDMIIDDVTKPQADRIQIIYRKFLMTVMDISESSMGQLPIDSLTSYEVSESHSRAIPLVILYNLMVSFVADYRGDSELVFSMNDLVDPGRDPRRTKRLLALVADCLRFHAVITPIFEHEAKQSDARQVELNDRNEQVRYAERDKAELLSAEDGRKRRENALLAELGGLNAQLKDAMKKSEDCTTRHTEVVRETELEKFTKEELSSERDCLHGQLDHLSKGIISSPERVLSDRDRQRDEIIKLTEACNILRRQNDELDERIQMGGTVETLCEKIASSIEELNKFAQDVSSYIVEKSETERHLQQTNYSLEKICSSIQQALDLDATEREGRLRDAEIHQERVSQLNEKILSLEDEVQHLRQGHSVGGGGGGGSVKYAMLQKEIANVRSERAEAIAKKQAEMAATTKAVIEIQHHLDKQKENHAQHASQWREHVASIEKAILGCTDGNLTGNMSFF